MAITMGCHSKKVTVIFVICVCSLYGIPAHVHLQSMNTNRQGVHLLEVPSLELMQDNI